MALVIFVCFACTRSYSQQQIDTVTSTDRLRGMSVDVTPCTSQHYALQSTICVSSSAVPVVLLIPNNTNYITNETGGSMSHSQGLSNNPYPNRNPFNFSYWSPTSSLRSTQNVEFIEALQYTPNQSMNPSSFSNWPLFFKIHSNIVFNQCLDHKRNPSNFPYTPHLFKILSKCRIHQGPPIYSES